MELAALSSLAVKAMRKCAAAELISDSVKRGLAGDIFPEQM